MKTVTIELPPELLQLLGTEEEAKRETKVALVLDLVRRGKLSRAKAAELLDLSLRELSGLLAQWIVRHQVQDQDAVLRLRGRLGRGEAEAIVLAKELRADYVVLDDATARRIAEAEGCLVLGLLGLLVHAKERGLIPAVKSVLDRILAAGFYLDDELYRAILKSSREGSTLGTD